MSEAQVEGVIKVTSGHVDGNFIVSFHDTHPFEDNDRVYVLGYEEAAKLFDSLGDYLNGND